MRSANQFHGYGAGANREKAVNQAAEELCRHLGALLAEEWWEDYHPATKAMVFRATSLALAMTLRGLRIEREEVNQCSEHLAHLELPVLQFEELLFQSEGLRRNIRLVLENREELVLEKRGGDEQDLPRIERRLQDLHRGLTNRVASPLLRSFAKPFDEINNMIADLPMEPELAKKLSMMKAIKTKTAALEAFVKALDILDPLNEGQIPDLFVVHTDQTRLQVLEKLRQARHLLSEAGAAFPSFPSIHLSLAHTAMAMDSWSEAQAALTAAAAFEQGKDVQEFQARIKEGAAVFDQKMKALLRQHNVNLKKPASLHAFALVLFAEGYSAEALRYCDKAISLDPYFSGALVTRSRILDREQRPGEALKALHQALQIDAGNAQAMALLAERMAESGQAFEALPMVDKALVLAPKLADVHLAKAAVLERLGRSAEAMSHWHEAVNRAERSAKARLCLAKAYHRRKQFDYAINQLEKAVALLEAQRSIDLERYTLLLADWKDELAAPR